MRVCDGLGAKLASLRGIVWVGLGLFLFGLASLFYPPLKLIIGSVTTSAAMALGGVASRAGDPEAPVFPSCLKIAQDYPGKLSRSFKLLQGEAVNPAIFPGRVRKVRLRGKGCVQLQTTTSDGISIRFGELKLDR